MERWIPTKAKDTNHSPRLLLRPSEAAESLAISERLLWTLTNNGEIQCVRIGRAIRYDPRDLIAWIDKRKTPIELNNTGNS